MSILFSQFVTACIESSNEEFNELILIFNQVDSFKEKVLMKYFLLLKQEEKTIKLFQTFSLQILPEYIQYAAKHNMLQLLFYFSKKEPEMYLSCIPGSNPNFYKLHLFELIFL